MRDFEIKPGLVKNLIILSDFEMRIVSPFFETTLPRHLSSDFQVHGTAGIDYFGKASVVNVRQLAKIH